MRTRANKGPSKKHARAGDASRAPFFSFAAPPRVPSLIGSVGPRRRGSAGTHVFFSNAHTPFPSHTPTHRQARVQGHGVRAQLLHGRQAGADDVAGAFCFWNEWQVIDLFFKPPHQHTPSPHTHQVVVVGMSVGFIACVTLLHIIGKVRVGERERIVFFCFRVQTRTLSHLSLPFPTLFRSAACEHRTCAPYRWDGVLKRLPHSVCP